MFFQLNSNNIYTVATDGPVVTWPWESTNSGTASSSGAVTNCGESLTATSSTQSFSSPNYPDNYDVDMYCEWTISANDIITLVFEAFDVSKEKCILDTFFQSYFFSYFIKN